MMQPDRVVAESYEFRAGKFFAFVTSFVTLLLNTTSVNLTSYVMT